MQSVQWVLLFSKTWLALCSSKIKISSSFSGRVRNTVQIVVQAFQASRPPQHLVSHGAGAVHSWEQEQRTKWISFFFFSNLLEHRNTDVELLGNEIWFLLLPFKTEPLKKKNNLVQSIWKSYVSDKNHRVCYGECFALSRKVQACWTWYKWPERFKYREKRK